eukprot:1333967-Amphidinium_carterae.1
MLLLPSSILFLGLCACPDHTFVFDGDWMQSGEWKTEQSIQIKVSKLSSRKRQSNRAKKIAKHFTYAFVTTDPESFLGPLPLCGKSQKALLLQAL